jgi:Leucine-rich repeat (LRR) protein
LWSDLRQKTVLMPSSAALPPAGGPGKGESPPQNGSSSTTLVPSGGDGGATAGLPGRLEISFPAVIQPLILPPESEGAKFTKRFDFQGTLKKPFAFADGFEEIEEEPDAVPDAEAHRLLPPPETFAKTLFTEDRGKQWDDRFDNRALASQRAQIPFVKWVPHILRGEEPPLPPLDSFSSKEKTMDIAAWVQVRSKENIRYARFEDKAIPSKGLKAISRLTTESFNLEVLIMRNVGLKKIPQFKLLRRLKYLDISKNSGLKDQKGLVKFLVRAPFMETVLALDTPMALKPLFRPTVIATNVTMTLKNVNGTKVGIEERMDALAKFGTRESRRDLPAMRWDLQVSTLNVIKSMRASMDWRPSAITQIVLPECGLLVFFVGECSNLVHLDLSGNRLNMVRGTGLEQCKALEFLSLKDNMLGKAELRVLPFLSSLKVLLLEGNKGLGPPQSYRATAIALTQHSLGTNRCPGLVQLDDEEVTPEERVQAMTKMDQKVAVDDIRWRFNLIDYYGHRQIRTKDYLARVTQLNFCRTRLAVADLSPMLSLEEIDLSYNNLRTVVGLEGLTRVRILNLFGNPRLDMREIMPRLLKINSLAQISFGVEEKSHARFAGSAKYRAKILKDLIFNNPNLRFLDDKLITPLERVETLRSMGQDEDLIERYRFELIVNVNCTMPFMRRYHFTEVGIGNQYEPKDITVLRRLNDCGLTSAACDFRKFKNLEELNLSGNKLTNIRDLLLFKLPKLRVLDVTRNQITTPIEELAADIDNLRALEVLAIRDNPIFGKNFFMSRMKLIGHMQRMRDVECTLEVIDFGISLDERVDGWKATGGKDEDVEIMRYKAIMFLRAPRGTPTDQLTELDLSMGGLSHVDLSMFGQLKVLLLTENRIQSASALKGLSSCKRLRVLDLRRNELAKITDIPEIIGQLPRLESLGLSGNKCMRGQAARDKLISLLPQLHEERCSLRAIDGREISVAEIVRSWKVSSGSSPDRIR